MWTLTKNNGGLPPHSLSVFNEISHVFTLKSLNRSLRQPTVHRLTIKSVLPCAFHDGMCISYVYVCTSQDISADLILSIEYLDYAREAHPRPGVDLMPANLRSLHSISCLLANMPAIVNPAVGRAAAVESCEELNLCILALRNEVGCWRCCCGCFCCW